MTLSPVENAHMSKTAIAGVIVSQARVFTGGVVTGPVFGWFGQRWRAHRACRGALATAAALCLEPLARIPTGHAIRSSTVLLAEVAIGIAMVTYVVTRIRMSPQAGQHRGNAAG
jgi:hypothetical protein